MHVKTWNAALKSNKPPFSFFYTCACILFTKSNSCMRCALLKLYRHCPPCVCLLSKKLLLQWSSACTCSKFKIEHSGWKTAQHFIHSHCCVTSGRWSEKLAAPSQIASCCLPQDCSQLNSCNVYTYIRSVNHNDRTWIDAHFITQAMKSVWRVT